MLFHVIYPKNRIQSYQEKHVYLVKTDWNDWWEYENLYRVFIIYNGSLKELGSTKIACQGSEKKQKLPGLFDDLPEGFFSLGQDEYYYENIKELGNEIREKILKSLKDIAFDLKLFSKYRREDVMKKSLLRSIPASMVRNQFNRIANGGARLTKYKFSYISCQEHHLCPQMKLDFEVFPESLPATNIHVLIGKNGVGKTTLITNMIRSITKGTNKIPNVGEMRFDGRKESNQFSQVIFVSFNPFDEPVIKSESQRFISIGLPRGFSSSQKGYQDDLSECFFESFQNCVKNSRLDLLKDTLGKIKKDPIFDEMGITEYLENERDVLFIENRREQIKEKFKKLSSGHKIVLLSLTQLVEKVEEKTIVFFDEPEGHLHPPLLAAYIFALSGLLIQKNGVAIIATHSPIILQEVPSSCVWKLRRNGAFVKADRLSIESYGQDVGSLITEVFGLEVMDSGFHALLQSLVDEGLSYDEVLEKLNHKLGSEGRCILQEMLTLKK